MGKNIYSKWIIFQASVKSILLPFKITNNNKNPRTRASKRAPDMSGSATDSRSILVNLTTPIALFLINCKSIPRSR